MTVLIDKIKYETDGGYVLNEQKRPIAFHSAIKEHLHTSKNTKLITSGHVYVLNYDESTYVPKSPETYEEYRLAKTKQ